MHMCIKNSRFGPAFLENAGPNAGPLFFGVFTQKTPILAGVKAIFVQCGPAKKSKMLAHPNGDFSSKTPKFAYKKLMGQHFI